MTTYRVTYWTKTTETVTAGSLAEAYVAAGYSVTSHETHMWDNEDGTGSVTNMFGDHCATIAPVDSLPVSLIKAYLPRGMARDQASGRSVPVARADAAAFILGNPSRVELLGNTSVGRIVRPEFGGQSIARGELRPLTRFDS